MLKRIYKYSKSSKQFVGHINLTKTNAKCTNLLKLVKVLNHVVKCLEMLKSV